MLHLGTRVERLDLAGEGRPCLRLADGSAPVFDQVVFTGPIAALSPLLVGGQLADRAAAAGEGIDMQGVVNAVLLLRRGLTPHYWVASIDPEVPFQGIVESTTLMDRQETAGLHLIYLMNYLHRTDPLFARSDEQILQAYVAGLKRLFPDLRDEDVVQARVFRSAFVEPLYTLGYQRRQPPVALVPGRVFLSTAAQVYPEVTSWNGSAGLARRIVDQMLAER